MVLAAGYGTRLRPLADRIPKPLIPVAGKPMIQYSLERLKEYGIGEVIINVSHLKEQLTNWLSSYPGLTIKISEEAVPLETGGGLKHALPLLGTAPFFTINSDAIWFDEQQKALERLARFWDDSKMDILLLAQCRAKAPGYETGEDHLFIKPDNTFEWDSAEAPYIFGSVTLIHPRILRNAPDGKFSVKLLWREALAKNRLYAVPHYGQWFQAGTAKDIAVIEKLLLPRAA